MMFATMFGFIKPQHEQRPAALRISRTLTLAGSKTMPVTTLQLYLPILKNLT
jgi:hypothetical protein